MSGDTSEQQQATVPMDTEEVDNHEYKAFVALQDDLAKQLEYCANSAANYAYGADLIPEDVFEKVFDRDMASNSDATKILYLIKSVRNRIKKASSLEEASKKMKLFLGCLRKDSVFDALVKSLEDKVEKYEKDKKAEPEFRALKDPDIAILAAGSVTNLATSTYSKGLLAEGEYQFIISGGNGAKMFVLALLDVIARQIREDPSLLETFIKEVLDKIGPPVSNFGDRLRGYELPPGSTC